MRKEAPPGCISPLESYAAAGRFLLDFSRRKQKESLGSVNILNAAAVGRQVFVNSAGLSGIRMTVQWVKYIFNEGFCACCSGSQVFAGWGTLRTDCELLESRPDEKDERRAL